MPIEVISSNTKCSIGLTLFAYKRNNKLLMSKKYKTYKAYRKKTKKKTELQDLIRIAMI